MDRASPEHEPGSDPASGGAVLDDAQALARASAAERATRGRPNALVPTHGSSSSDEGGGHASAEEEDQPRVARLVAERRLSKLSDPPPVGFRRDRWLETTAADVLAKGGSNIRALLGQGMAVDAIVDLFEPPDKPAAPPPNPYPDAGQQPEPAFDVEFDEDGHAFAVPRSA